MTENEKNFNLIDARRRAIIEKAISENTTYRTMMESLSESGINIDIKNLVDKYIEIYGASNFDSNSIDSFETINNFILSSIDDISKEDNGVILNDDGTKKEIILPDVEMDRIFSGLPDYALEEQKENLFVSDNPEKSEFENSRIYNKNEYKASDESFRKPEMFSEEKSPRKNSVRFMQRIKDGFSSFISGVTNKIKETPLLSRLISQSKQLALQEPEFIENNNDRKALDSRNASKINSKSWIVSPDIIESTKKVSIDAKNKLENKQNETIQNKKDIEFDEK